MENTPSSSASSSTSKAWSLCAVCFLGMLVFAGLYFSNKNTTRTVSVPVNTITVVTNEVIKEFPKEIQKIIEVPANIPSEYIDALRIWNRISSASLVREDQVLFGMKDVRTYCTVDPRLQDLMSDDELKAKFELTLRRNNVPLNPNSQNAVHFRINGFTDPSIKGLVVFSTECSVFEVQPFYRDGEWRKTLLEMWSKGNGYGTVGKDKANETWAKEAERQAEVFANDFLTANPKNP